MNRLLPAVVGLGLPSGAFAWGAVWPPGGSAATSEMELRLSCGWQEGMVPQFRAAERDRGTVEISSRWQPSDRVWLDLRASALSDRTQVGDWTTGPGDFRIGTMILAVDRRIDTSFGWQAKVPSAADEGELGTDETDVLLFGEVSSQVGQAWLSATGGLAVLGNPLRFANQDDVVFLWGTGVVPMGPLNFAGRIGGDLPSSRNPARLRAAVGVEHRCPWLVGAEGTAGLSAASEDWGARIWIGYGWGCPASGGD